MQEAFREAGIEFAHCNVTVYMPAETDEKTSSVRPDPEAETNGTSDRKSKQKAGAAAAIAVAQAEEDHNQPK